MWSAPSPFSLCDHPVHLFCSKKCCCTPQVAKHRPWPGLVLQQLSGRQEHRQRLVTRCQIVPIAAGIVGAVAVISTTSSSDRQRYATALLATAASSTVTENLVDGPKAEETFDDRTVCCWCGQRFPSRTKLFRHLRTAIDCMAAVARQSENSTGSSVPLPIGRPQSVAFLVGYMRDSSLAEDRVLKVLAQLPSVASAAPPWLSRVSGDATRSAERADASCGLSILKQDEDCAAVGDVITARFASAFEGEALTKLLQEAIEVTEDALPAVVVLDFRVLPPKALPFAAETHCTQRIYDCLLPLQALAAGNQGEDTEGRRQCWKQIAQEIQELVLPPASGGVTMLEPLPSGSQLQHTVRSFKHCLLNLLDQVGVEAENFQDAQFFGGKLYGSEQRRRAKFHNFGDSRLEGALDPQKQAVLCALDYFRIMQVVSIGGQVFVQLRVAGDRFLTQHVRRLVATAVCIHHGWLPSDFFSTSIRSDAVVRTPAAPEGLCFLHSCLFSVWTRRHGRLFDRSWASRLSGGNYPGWREEASEAAALRAANSIKAWTQRVLVNRAANAGGSQNGEFVERWLCQLQQEDVPKALSDMHDVAELNSFAAATGRWRTRDAALRTRPRTGNGDCPEVYCSVLRLLRRLKDSGGWPKTSISRARVIRAPGLEDRMTGGGKEQSFSWGTFSLAAYASNVPEEDALREELRAAVFRLERELVPHRPPSTWVAINCNAMFSPHTDAGTGKGQSSSLIVGLGDYDGGELVVERATADIRYSPLEFDGWRQRHWTLPFHGERFTLVWFSPRTQGVADA